MFLPRLPVRLGVIGFYIVALDFLDDFVSRIDLLIFNVENRIDEVFELQQTKPVLPTEAGEQRAVARSALALEIKLGGPPGLCAVLEFEPIGIEVSCIALCSERGEIFDLKISWLFQIVIVGHDIRSFLRRREERRDDEHRSEDRASPN